jgi:alcohol dehydrogenase class IV
VVRAARGDDPDDGPSAATVDASVLAGRSLQSSSDGLARALVRLITARADVAHGAAHAAVVVHVARMLVDAVDPDSTRPLARALGVDEVEAIPAALDALRGDIGVTGGLSDLGLDDEDLDAIARQSASQPGVQRSARPLGESDVRALLDDAC